MRPRTRIGLLVTLLAAACGTNGGTTPPQAPAISITSPLEGATVALGTDSNASVAISYAVNNFNLMAPSTCGGTPDCGHVHVLIDGAACNASSFPYNNAGSVNPISALFALCTTPTGAHVVTLELHHDNHAPVTDSSGATISDSVSLTTTAPPPTPSIAITGPEADSTVILPGAASADLDVSVPFTVSNFTLMAPSTCGTTPNCGHIHVLIDGTACNNGPYNNAAFVSPAIAKFVYCTPSTGSHTIRLELHNDNHSPVQVGGVTVADERPVTTIDATTPPASILISNPADGATVSLQTNQTVPIDFVMTGLTLADPCGSTAACGHVLVEIDGAACDDTGASLPYNNTGTSSPIDAKFGLCATATGSHQVTLRVVNDGAHPFFNADATGLSAAITITTN